MTPAIPNTSRGRHKPYFWISINFWANIFFRSQWPQLPPLGRYSERWCLSCAMSLLAHVKPLGQSELTRRWVLLESLVWAGWLFFMSSLHRWMCFTVHVCTLQSREALVAGYSWRLIDLQTEHKLMAVVQCSWDGNLMSNKSYVSLCALICCWYVNVFSEALCCLLRDFCNVGYLWPEGYWPSCESAARIVIQALVKTLENWKIVCFAAVTGGWGVPSVRAITFHCMVRALSLDRAKIGC